MSEEVTQSPPETLDNLLAVHEYVKKKGYRVGKSSVYNHKNEGKLRPDPITGQYLVVDVDKYADRHLVRTDGTTKNSAKTDTMQVQKLAQEIRIRTAQAEQEEIEARKAKKEVIPVAAVNIRDSAKASVLISDDLNWIFSAAPVIIEKVNGDPALESELIEFMRTDRERIYSRYDDKTDITVELPAALLADVQNLDDIEGLDEIRNG